MWLAWGPVTFASRGEHGTIDGVSVLVRAVTNVDGVLAATALFDMPPTAAGAAAFVDAPGHHLLVAEVDGVPAGFGTAIEMRHPDKGLEVFLYELGVDERYRRQGVTSALLAALDDLAVRLGATGCWTATEPHNTAALGPMPSMAQPGKMSRCSPGTSSLAGWNRIDLARDSGRGSTSR